MDHFLERIFIEPFELLFDRFIEFLPNILASILLLIAGIVVGVIFRVLFLNFLRAMKVDKVTERSGVVEMMRKGGIREPLSVVLSRLLSWVVIAIFAVISLWALNLPAIEQVIERLFLYLPNVFIALVILGLGYFLGNFAGRAALIAAVNAGIKMSGMIGRSVKLAIVVMALTMALEQLGIARDTIIIAFTILFGGIVLALSLAFGLAGRDMAREYLEKKLKEGGRNDVIEHL